MTVEQWCQWLLNNFASDCWTFVPVTVEQSCQWLLNNHASGCWIIVPVTVEELCRWLLNNSASDCWIIVPVTVEQFCQRLLNIRASDCWTIAPVTVEQSCQWLLNNRASDCWRIMPVTVEQSCQWLLNNCPSDCWIIVPVTVEELYQRLLRNCASEWIVATAVEQSCQLFFFSPSNFTLAKSLPVFLVNTSIIITDYFSSVYLSLLINNYLHIFIIHVLPTFVTFQNLNQTNKVGIVGKPLVSETSLYIFCQKSKKWNFKKPDEYFWIFNLFI